MFSLTKWYLDCVDAEGQTAIAYWSELAWDGLSITWHSASLHESNAPPLQRASMAAAAAPMVSEEAIVWQAPALGWRVTCRPHVPAFERTLLETRAGVIAWRCEAASGDTVVECDGRMPIRGRGYAECLRLTLPPWKMPIDELHWGRWIALSSRQSVVWINWRGAQPLTACFVDGKPELCRVADDSRIEIGSSILELGDRRVLYARSLSDTLGGLRAVLAPVVPSTWMALEDCKWRSVGTLRSADGRSERGWVVHEKVKFPQ